MNVWFIKTKIFALSFLIFANFMAAAAQQQQTDSIYQLQAGTIFRLEMDNEINSRAASVNDTFTATIAAPLIKRETVVLPVGTIIEGRVTKVRRAALGGKSGILEVSFQTIRFRDGAKRDIEGVLVNALKIESAPTVNVLTILGGTAIGAAIGGAAAKSGGAAAVGAGLGAGAGAGIAFFRKGKEVRIEADEQFEMKLTKTVNLPVQDY